VKCSSMIMHRATLMRIMFTKTKADLLDFLRLHPYENGARYSEYRTEK
jgi:hypothetical protein